MKNNIILDNIIFCLQEIGGISNYWFNLLNQFVKEDNIFYYLDSENEKNHYRKLLTLPENRCIEDQSKIPLKIKRYLPVNKIKKIHGFDIFHSSYYRYSQDDVKNITTVHDFMYEKFLSKYNIRRIVHNRQKYLALKHSVYIIGISKNTLDDMVKYFPEFKGKKKQVIWHGVSNDFFVINDKNPFLEIQNQKIYYNSYYFYLGNRQGYKNFILLLKAYAKLIKNVPDCPKLLVAGGGNFADIENRIINELGINETIIKMNNVKQEELNCIYNYCTGFVYPSLYEGFGMPILEAMKAGCPVICSNTSSLPEVAGEAAIYFNPNDVEDLEKSLYNLLDLNTRKELIKKGLENVKKFTWENTCKKTLEAYDSV